MMTKAVSEYLIEQCDNVAAAAQRVAEMAALGETSGISTPIETMTLGLARVRMAVYGPEGEQP